MLAHWALIAFIATTQPERAKVFYCEVLGTALDGGYTLCPGI